MSWVRWVILAAVAALMATFVIISFTAHGSAPDVHCGISYTYEQCRQSLSNYP